MLLSQLTYFEALARERHFGRAAASCFVTTSTLSEAIRKLEKEVGSPLVNRSHSAFQGLTHEGELVLTYARRITADQRHLEEDLAAARGELSATVRVGVIPAGTGWAARLLDRIAEANPWVRFDLRAGLRSEEIVEGLRAHRDRMEHGARDYCGYRVQRDQGREHGERGLHPEDGLEEVEVRVSFVLHLGLMVCKWAGMYL